MISDKRLKIGPLFLLLLIVLLAGCAEETALEETFSTDYFAVNYSSEWHVVTEQYVGMSEFVMFYFRDEHFDEQREEGINGIGIVVEENVRFTAEQYHAADDLEEMLGGIEILDSGPIELAGIEGHERTYTTQINGDHVQFREIIIIDEDNTAYNITFYAREAQVQEYQSEVDSFLSSFELK